MHATTGPLRKVWPTSSRNSRSTSGSHARSRGFWPRHNAIVRRSSSCRCRVSPGESDFCSIVSEFASELDEEMRLHLELAGAAIARAGDEPRSGAPGSPARVRQSRGGGDRQFRGLGLERVGTAGAGCAIRASRAPQDARLHRGSGGNPGRRAGNEYRGVQHRKCRDVAQPSLPSARPAGVAVGRGYQAA